MELREEKKEEVRQESKKINKKNKKEDLNKIYEERAELLKQEYTLKNDLNQRMG